MTNEHLPIPIDEMRKFLKVDRTSKTGLRWIKKSSKNSPIKVGDDAGCYDKGSKYYVLTFNSKKYLAHRIVYALYHGIDPGDFVVDHINWVKTDNSVENLRLLNHSDSVKHTKGRGKSKYKGVTHDKRKKKNPWKSYINLNGKDEHIGCFATEIEAAKEAAPHYIARDGYYLWPED